MKLVGVILCTIILFVGFIISPATGNIFEADVLKQNLNVQNNEETITVYFLDFTEKRPVEKSIDMTATEWNMLKSEIREIRETSQCIEESINAQLDIFYEYDLIDNQITYNDLQKNANEVFKHKAQRTSRTPLFENVIFNMICAISFELESGNNLVFGLNTFINIIGFNIISVHKGYSPDGISTLGGLLAQETDPGEYVGMMFGFFGYWFGTKTGTGTYSDLICAGFTVTTLWLPITS